MYIPIASEIERGARLPCTSETFRVVNIMTSLVFGPVLWPVGLQCYMKPYRTSKLTRESLDSRHAGAGSSGSVEPYRSGMRCSGLPNLRLCLRACTHAAERLWDARAA